MKQCLLNKGYVMISRALLMNICNEHPKAGGNFEAFLRVLIYANFETHTVQYRGTEIECKRGESIISFTHWAEIFGWSRGKTRHFFKECFADGRLQLIEDGCACHISIPGYDAWTGAQISQGKNKRPKDELFVKFWEDYHEITHLAKAGSTRAYQAWKRLSVNERQLAVKNIDDYYHQLKNTRFCLQAATYLKDKAFNPSLL